VGGGGTMSALNEQIGGNHYKNFEIQPIEFIMKNRLSFLQGSVIKRICRYNTPTGGVRSIFLSNWTGGKKKNLRDLQDCSNH
jgi:hypothetical protein